ncbi:MAG: hypothetical protein P8X57_00855 [Cyclobacteriaceae bacterium]
MHQHLFRLFVPAILIFLGFSIISFRSQDHLEMEGSWKIDNVQLSDQFEYDPSTEAQLLQIAEALVGSRLELDKKGLANFNTKVPQLYVEDARWSYINTEGRLQLTDNKDASSVIMEFLVIASTESTLFYLAESPFVFHMNRIKK